MPEELQVLLMLALGAGLGWLCVLWIKKRERGGE